LGGGVFCPELCGGGAAAGALYCALELGVYKNMATARADNTAVHLKCFAVMMKISSANK
jgi:hypothetical protein